MKVLVLTPYLHDTAPAMRFRTEQWARLLEPQGLRFTFVPFEDQALHQIIYQKGWYARKAVLLTRALVRRFALLPRVRDFDVVLLLREASLLGPQIIEWFITRQKIPMVFDFDDPVWMPYRSPANGVLSYLKCPAKTAGICRLATVVTVGNRLLAGWARQHARQVEIVPSTVDLDRYPVKPHTGGGPITLGWTGSHSTLPFLEPLIPTLRRFADRQRYNLVVISHSDSYRLESFPAEVRAKKWRAATEAEDLHELDIGLAPFPNSGWTPWRCHGKVLQYMAVGIPTIASSIGILPEYIQNGKNGFLATTEIEWLDCLARLSEDENLRRRMGGAARETIADHYSAHVWAPRVREILEKAIGSQPAVLTGPSRNLK